MRGRRLWLAGLALLAAAALLACGGGEAAPAPAAGTAVATETATPRATAEPTAAATPARTAAPEPAATATATPAPTPAALLTMAVCENIIALQEKAWVPTDAVPEGGPCLATISEGSETELILEWAGGPVDAAKWQYRQRTATGTWGAWTDIPTGSASARRHGVSGLQPEVYNYFEVRAVNGNVAGAQSNRALGVTPRQYGDLPEMELGQVSEGGRSWILGGSVVVDVPAGVRIMHKSGAYSGGTVVANVSEIETMSFQVFDLNTAEAAGRVIRGTGETASGLGTDALFDRLLASARLVDAPAAAPAATPTPPHTMESCVEHIERGTFAQPDLPEGGACLIVVSDGSADSLLLEWTGGAADATSWQYRRRLWNDGYPQAWGAWADIPGSDVDTQSYRLSGLSISGAEFQVRPMVNTVAGVRSNTAAGHTHKAGTTPWIGPGDTVEGDGRTEWQVHALHWVITIPDGVRITGGDGWVSADGGSGVRIFDTATGSRISFNTWGTVRSRYIKQRPGADADSFDWDVDALFDYIVDSIRELDPEEAPPLLNLSIVADGIAGALVLEWTSNGFPTHWQYRLRGPIWRDTGNVTWSAWQDIPDSDPNTRAHRITGLAPYRVYDFEIRPVWRISPGDPSNTARGITLFIGSDGIPEAKLDQVVLGGRKYRISGLDYVMDVPDSMRILVTGGGITSDGYLGVRVTDVISGDFFQIDGFTGRIIGIYHFEEYSEFTAEDADKSPIARLASSVEHSPAPPVSR